MGKKWGWPSGRVWFSLFRQEELSFLIEKKGKDITKHLVIHQHWKAWPPQLPVGDGAERPPVLAPALELVVAQVRRGQSGSLVRGKGLDFRHLKRVVAEADCSVR